MVSMIARYDENFTRKANKGDVIELRELKLNKQEIEPIKLDIIVNKEQTDEEIKKLRRVLDAIGESMEQSIYDSVKKANNTIIKQQEKLEEKRRKAAIEDMKLKAELFEKAAAKAAKKSNKKGGSNSRSPDSKIQMTITPLPRNSQMEKDENDEVWKNKADMKDLLAMNELKTNKFDTEILMRCVDVQHKHISHIAVLFNEISKTLISTKKESEAAIQNKRMYILEQSNKVLHWIGQFEP